LPPFRKLAEREIYRGHLISVGSATFESASGQRFERDVVHHPGAASVVPVIDEGAAVLMVRQFRAAIGTDLLEIPAGKRDASEPPEATARRELEEEIGMRAGRLEQLAEFYNSPGFCDERSFVYMALDLDAVGRPDPQGPEEELMTIERIVLDDVPALITSGTIVDAKSIIGLCLARSALT